LPRIHDLQPNLSAGELSPRLAARLDFVKYPAGLEICENLIPLSEGGLMRRSGTRYIAEEKSSTVKGRLKRFIFSVTQAYILELGNTIVRFYRNQGQIAVADTDAVVTNGTFKTDINFWDDRSTGTGALTHDATNQRLSLQVGGTRDIDIGWAEQDITTTNTNTEHVIKFRVIGAPGDKIEFQVGTAASGAQTLAAVEKEVGYHCVAFTPTTSPFYIQFRNRGNFRKKIVQIDDVSLIDNSPVEIDTPWLEADLYTVEGTQSADVFYNFHADYPTYKLQRFGHTTWSLVEVAWQDGPYLDENTSTTTITPSADSGLKVNFTLSSIAGVNDNQGWLSTDVGRSIRYKKDGGSAWSWAVITSITSTTVVVADIRETSEFSHVWQADDTPADNAFVDETADANSSTDADWTLFPATEATGDYAAFGFTQTFSQISFDYINGTAGIGGVVAWEYWDGSAWAALTGVTDNTTGFTAAAADDLTVSWSIPTDWAKQVISTSASLYFVRARITTVYSTNPVLDQGSVRIQSTPITTTSFRLGAWSGTTGYPQVASFFEQRLYVAATNNQPQTFWASQTADFENLKPDDGAGILEADDAFNFTLSADDVNAIRWLSSGEDVLVIGTQGGEWVPSSDGVVITPLDISVRRQTKHGSAQIQPVRVGNTVLFVQRAKRKIREFGISEFGASYLAPDMTRLAKHITLGGIIEMDFAEEQESLVQAVRNDGQLLSLTIRREEDIVGFGRHILGGSFEGGDAVVESVAIIPGNDGSGQTQDSANRDEIWVTVKRTINSATKRYIEFFERDFETGDAQEDAYYSDSLITLDSPETISGATKANPVVLTITATTLSNGDEIRVTDVKGTTELNNNTYKVANKATNTIELTSPDDDSNIDGTGFTTYISGGKVNLKGTAITGLGHLEGETIKVWGDGAIQTDKTVSSGSITADEKASVFQIGLGFTHKMKTLKISAGNPAGTPLGKIKRIYGITFVLLNSHTLKFGPDSSNLTTKDFRIVADPMDNAAPLFTGEQFVEFSGDWGRDGRIVIESDDPSPFFLLALAPEINLNTLK